MRDWVHCLASALAVVYVASLPRPAAGQLPGNALVLLTLNTGAVIVGEVKGETSNELKVYNLDSGEVESYPKARTYARRTATEAKLLSSTVKTEGKRPERLEALLAREVTSTNPEMFTRLGRFPENAAAYLAWAAARLVLVKEDRPGTVAVLPLQETRGGITPETTRRTEELTNALTRRKASLVERGQFDKVYGELRLESGAAFDPALAQRFGKQVGAQAVLIGTLVPRGRVSDLNLRLVETETGRVLDAPTIANVPRGGSDALSKKNTPSFVGRWELRNPKGVALDFTVLSNGTCFNAAGGRGTWKQSNLQLQILFLQKGSNKPMRFEGDLEPDGQGFQLATPTGELLTGIRR